MALWLHAQVRREQMYLTCPGNVEDQAVYWAVSGWDLNLLLESEASAKDLQAFLNKYPSAADVRLVKYALAVRLARENRYEESAELYQSVHANARAARMRQLATLYHETTRTDITPPEQREAKYKMAEFLDANQERIYFNDSLWGGLQRYALFAHTEARVTRQERIRLIANERRLKDEQEERWRAYLLLRDVIRQSDNKAERTRAVRLAVRCLRWIRTDRFGREEDIRRAIRSLTGREA